MVNNPILAANPEISAIVKASAGVGKTYLLVTRLLRLLLMDVRPDAILAITFTRKASAEMQSRLFERLYHLAISSEATVIKELQNIGVDATPALVQSAQQLYEKLMRSEYQVKTSTFHAFCQTVLQKFPLEAEVPPGFELLEDEVSYRAAAWDALYDEATQDPHSQTAQALETLYELNNGLSNTHLALDNLLNQRSDWWAFTQGQTEPVVYASQQLQTTLEIAPTENPYQEFFSDNNRQKLSRLVQLLNTHDTKTNLKHADKIQRIIENEIFLDPNPPQYKSEKCVNALYAFFLNKDDENRHHKTVKSREKKLGENGEREFLEICLSFTVQLLSLNEQRLKHHLFHTSSAWYVAGQRLIELYQKLKLEQRLLDFVDLEWNTYQLLNHSDNAMWIQYKLDQRLDHLLIDEFQDTNPTQWRLILPLLEEFSATQEASRSVFIVGDEKQSIYGFRRADPRLLFQAGQWIEENLQAKTFPMDKSRRSSPAVITLLNSLFQDAHFEKRLPSFHTHSTFLNNAPGQITLLPLIHKEASPSDINHFRNPLEQPLVKKDQPYYREGQQMSSHIQQLIETQCVIESPTGPRPIEYADIMILVRSRTHVADYERAFLEAKLPYISNNKGTLLECQEIQDLMALLDVLYTPYNNLAFATVLRSPIFQCNNDDLIFIATQAKSTSWYEAIHQLDDKNVDSQLLLHAMTTLTRWRMLSGHLPIHDLLDMLFHEANIIQQYESQVPTHVKSRVRANLNQFLSLALEIESGRYPSLGRFIGKLKHMLQNKDSPDETGDTSHEGAIRILTIHASKGLEAPVVFLADAADVKKSSKNSYQALIQWPENKKNPTDFLLCPNKDKQPTYVKKLLEINNEKTNTEDANLLYVALTRARQALYISGCGSEKPASSWYHLIETCWPDVTQRLPVTRGVTQETAPKTITNQEIKPSPTLFSNPTVYHDKQASSPIHSEEENGTLRGTIIHRALELLEKNASNEIEAQLRDAFFDGGNQELIKDCIREALSVFSHPQFCCYFNPNWYSQAYNEMPICLNIKGKSKHGIIDRVIKNDAEIIILDYKTHRNIDIESLPDVAREHQEQMQFYQQAAQTIWPSKSIRLTILFTHFLQVCEL